MAQFDVHRLGAGPTLVVDCQSDLLSHIDSRFVVPLIPRDLSPPIASRLNPLFEIDGGDYVMLTQAAASVRRVELSPAVVSLAAHDREIMNALDILLTGV